MQRPVVLLLAFLSLPTAFLRAQENPQQPSGTPSSLQGSNSLVVNLLQQSHDLNPQLSLPTRIYLLQRQAEAMAPVDAELSQAWAQELLALSRQAKGELRSFAEDSAMSILVRFNPDQSLTLLHSLSPAETQADGTPSLPNMKLVQRVFNVLVERDGVSAFPVLEQEAARMGTGGTYPYGALGYAAMQCVSKDWGSNSPHAIEVLHQVFERAFERYRSEPRTYLDDYEFGKMLQVLAGGIQGAVRPGLRLLVKNVLTTDTGKYRFEAGVYTNDGKEAKVDNAIDAALLDLGRLINRIDPELAEQLESTRPELQTALQYAKDGRVRTWSFGERLPPRAVIRPQQDSNAMDATRLASIDPAAAIAKAEELPPGARRADTMLQIARDLAGKQPERAQELIAQVEGSNKTDTPELELDVVSVKTAVAAGQDKKGETRELLQQGFAIATPIVLELQKSGNAPFVPGLGQLVQIGMQNDLDSTITFLQGLPASWLKANLLLGAASALTMKTHLPIGSREVKKPEKSN